MRYNLIVCVNKRNVIGRNGDLLYHLKDDLKRFKKLTEFGVVVMGSKTYESLPNKPLKNRINVIITSKDGVDGSNVVYSKDLLSWTEKVPPMSLDNVWVIGGASIYQQFIDADLIDKVYLTVVDDDSLEENDIILKSDFSNSDKWKLLEETEPEEKGEVDFKYLTYQRR